MLNLVVTSRLGVQFSGREVMTTEEVESAFQILKRTSARSVAGLAHVGPAWIVQTHPSHVETVTNLMATLTNLDRSNIQVIGRTEGKFDRQDLSNLEVPDRYLCVRLDADDYYFPDAITHALRRFAGLAPDTLIDFPKGYLFDLATGLARRSRYAVQGPFFGVIATPQEPLPIVGHHGKARHGRDCVEVLSRSWVQTIHTSNHFSQFRMYGGTISEFRAMVRQAKRAHGSRPLTQLAGRPFDLIPLTSRTQKRLQRLVS